MLKLNRTSGIDSDFINLIALLDEDLKIRDGKEHGFYAEFNKVHEIGNVIVCFDGDVAVGCGAFKKLNLYKVEIKRMFVMTGYRHRGIGYAILNGLELRATELNYVETVLETGKKQPEAIALYQKAGYQVIENYGPYDKVENSVCMAKTLSKNVKCII